MIKKKYSVFYFKDNVCHLNAEVIATNKEAAMNETINHFGLEYDGDEYYIEVIEVEQVHISTPIGVLKNIGAYRYFKSLFKDFYENYLEI